MENIDYPLVGLDLVGIDDADGRALEHSDITRTLLNELLIGSGPKKFGISGKIPE